MGHLAGLGNSNILLGLREIMGALPCKIQLGGDLRAEPCVLQGLAWGAWDSFLQSSIASCPNQRKAMPPSPPPIRQLSAVLHSSDDKAALIAVYRRGFEK